MAWSDAPAGDDRVVGANGDVGADRDEDVDRSVDGDSDPSVQRDADTSANSDSINDCDIDTCASDSYTDHNSHRHCYAFDSNRNADSDIHSNSYTDTNRDLELWNNNRGPLRLRRECH